MKKVASVASRVEKLPAVPEMEYSSIICTRSSLCGHRPRKVTGRNSRGDPTKSYPISIKNISHNLDGEDTLESEFAKGIRGFLALRFTSPARPYDNLEKQSWYVPISDFELSRSRRLARRFELIPCVCYEITLCRDNIIEIIICICFSVRWWFCVKNTSDHFT